MADGSPSWDWVTAHLGTPMPPREPSIPSGVVRVPGVAEEDARRRHRERARLIRERVQHVNRIKGLLATQGIDDGQPLRPDRCQRLAGLRTGDGREIAPRLAAELGRELQRLELVLALLAELDAERDAIARGRTQGHPHGETIARLAQLKGIGPEFATVLVGEVLHRRLDNRRQVAAYVGLAGSPLASGRTTRDQGISKAGNPKARTTMIELAWLWRRHQPQGALAAWFEQRVGGLHGRIRRIAIVALARKLLVALWRDLETGVVPAAAALKG